MSQHPEPCGGGCECGVHSHPCAAHHCEAMVECGSNTCDPSDAFLCDQHQGWILCDWCLECWPPAEIITDVPGWTLCLGCAEADFE